MKTNTTGAAKGGESRTKDLLCSFWKGLGTPNTWLFAMLFVLIDEAITGHTIYGSFWMAISLFSYFLARIAVAIEKIADSRAGT